MANPRNRPRLGRLWQESDKSFLKLTMRLFGVKKLGIEESPSRAVHPDLWASRLKRMPVITVTREWARQRRSERESRLTHEMIHLLGVSHGDKPGGLVYSTYPAEDTYSRMVYSHVTAWAQGTHSGNPRLQIPIRSQRQLDELHAAEGHLRAAGVSFDTGAGVKDGKATHRDWELDWSLRGATIKNPTDLDLREDLVGSHSGQLDLRIYATVAGKPAGVIDYSEFQGEIHINNIGVYPQYQRQGVGMLMYRYLQAQNQGVRIHTGWMTEEGKAFTKALKKVGKSS